MQPAKQATSYRNWITDILILGAVFSILYFVWLGSYPFFTPDEGRYSEVAREMLASGDFITPRVNGVAFLDKPVLYYWLQAAAMYLFGVHEWSVRFFPAVYGIVGCLSIYLAGRRLFSRQTGIISAIILALSPLYFGASHYANLDLEIAVLISMSLLAFLTAAQSEGRTRSTLFIIAYVFAGLGFLTKGMMAIAFPVMIGGLWILLLSRWKMLLQMRLITGIVIIAAITLPWFILVQRANPEFLHFFFVTQQVTRFLSTAEFNNKAPVWFYVPVILAGFIPWTAFIIQAGARYIKDCWQSRQQHAAELFLLLWIAIIFIFFSIPHSKTVSYILPIFPPLALMIGKYLADTWSLHVRPRGIWLGIMIIMIMNLVVAALVFALPYFWVDCPVDFSPTLFVVGAELLAATLLLAFLMRRLGTAALFYICAVTSAVMLLTFSFGARHLTMNSAKPLVEQLRPLLKEGDTVANYFKFYQDVPLYLGRTIILVADWQDPNIAERDNWVRELWYSMPFQNTDEILLNEKTFWKRWHSNEKIYVFVNQNYLAQFQSHTRRYHVIGQHNDIILLSNYGSH